MYFSHNKNSCLSENTSASSGFTYPAIQSRSPHSVYFKYPMRSCGTIFWTNGPWRWGHAGQQTPSNGAQYPRRSVFLTARFQNPENSQTCLPESNVYWTVHHCNSWRMKDQLDVTCYFISLLMWCSFCKLKLCFSLQNEHHSKPAAPNLQHTTNWEQDDRCGNSTTQSQTPGDGYINVRNMLST